MYLNDSHVHLHPWQVLFSVQWIQGFAILFSLNIFIFRDTYFWRYFKRMHAIIDILVSHDNYIKKQIVKIKCIEEK